MVSLSPYGVPLVYSKQHGANVPYPSSSWYSNYPSHHVPGHPNNQFLSPPPGQVMDPSDSAAASFYNAHHHMLHQASPDWNNDNFALSTPNSQGFSHGTPSSSGTHLSPQSVSDQQNTSANNEGLGAMVNVPPSPPTTVSEMSSPGVAPSNNIPSMSGDDQVAHEELADDKTAFNWMKKPSYSTVPNPGMYDIYAKLLEKCRNVFVSYQWYMGEVVKWFDRWLL